MLHSDILSLSLLFNVSGKKMQAIKLRTPVIPIKVNGFIFKASEILTE